MSTSECQVPILSIRFQICKLQLYFFIPLPNKSYFSWSVILLSNIFWINFPVQYLPLKLVDLSPHTSSQQPRLLSTPGLKRSFHILFLYRLISNGTVIMNVLTYTYGLLFWSYCRYFSVCDYACYIKLTVLHCLQFEGTMNEHLDVV